MSIHLKELKHGDLGEATIIVGDPGRVSLLAEAFDKRSIIVKMCIRDRVNYVINTMSSEDKEVTNDGFLIRRVSAENNISCFTSFDTANAILKVLESLNFTTISMNELEY